MKQKIAIIGSGIAGMATAIRLAAMGYETVVYEASDKSGGKINQFSRERYRFDMGPTLFTMPELLEELFSSVGKNLQDFLPYQKLALVTRYFYEDGMQLDAYASPTDFAQELEKKLQIPTKQTLGFLEKSRELYEITSHIFLFNSINRAKTYLNAKAVKTLFKVHKLNAFKTMHLANSQWFKNDKAVRLFDRFATYNGSNPYQAPATLNIIPHLEHNMGAYFPSKGMYGIAEALYLLAKEIGVIFQFNTKVDEIVLAGKKVNGIRIGQDILNYDGVVSNMDVVPTYRKLLPQFKEPKIYTQQERSTSALIFYWGISTNFHQLDLHNILFSESYKAEFEALFKTKHIHHDPTVYLFISNKIVKDDAPQGCENWFVMINVPHQAGQDWENMINEARNNIIRKINRLLQTEIEKYIVFEEQLNPQLIEQRTSSHLGSLYGASSNGRFSAFLRHPNFSSRIKNLFFVGGSVHPGGGIPLCLASAKITGEYIKDEGLSK